MQSVCVVGLGSIGGFVAHRLASVGVPVRALARGATLAAVQARGLVMRDASDPEAGRAVPIQVSDAATELGVQECVILAVKTTALPTIPATIAPLMGPQTVVLSAMNGVPWWFFHGLDPRWGTAPLQATDPQGALALALPPSQVIGAVVHMAASSPEPGVVRHAFGERFIVGEPGGATTPRLSQLAALLRRGGLQVEETAHIELEVWLKLWGNMTMNPVSAITGATLDRILDDPLVRRFVSDAMVEARAVGEALGLPITLTPEERHGITRKLGAVKTSMLQDVEAGRPIELDALVGAVSEIGRRVGLPTPHIDALLGLTRVFAQVRGLVPQ